MSSSGQMGQATVEPELQGRTPRRVRYTRSTQRARFFFWLLFLGVIGLIGRLATNDVKQLQALQAHGHTATGHITGRHSSHGKNTTYYLDYMFMAGNGVVSDDESVSHSEYSDTQDGTPLTITYLPSAPDTHRVGLVDDRYFRHSISLWLLGEGAAFLPLSLILFFREKRLRGQRALLESGVAVTGRITNKTMIEGSKSNTYYVQYEFDGPNGTVSEKISVTKSLFDQTFPSSAAKILYNPATPNKNCPYYVLTDDVRLA